MTSNVLRYAMLAGVMAATPCFAQDLAPLYLGVLSTLPPVCCAPTSPRSTPVTKTIDDDSWRALESTLTAINAANNVIRMSVPQLELSTVAQALVDARNRGVRVFLIVGDRPIAMISVLPRRERQLELLNQIAAAGADIRLGWRGSRTNTLTIDADVHLSGSYEMASLPPARPQSQQLVVVVHDQRWVTDDVARFDQDFDRATRYRVSEVADATPPVAVKPYIPLVRLAP